MSFKVKVVVLFYVLFYFVVELAELLFSLWDESHGNNMVKTPLGVLFPHTWGKTMQFIAWKGDKLLDNYPNIIIIQILLNN